MENVEKKSRFSLKKMTAILLAVCLVTGAVPADSLWSVLAEAAESIAGTVSGNASGQQLATNTDLQPADGNKPAEGQAKPAAGSGSDGQVQPAAGSGSDAPVMLAAASGSAGGMKLAAASGSAGQQEPAAISALQATIEQRLSAMETLTGLVQIILSRNTTYEGDVRIHTDRQVANDFELALDAEDIPAEGLVSAGTATVAGNLVFKGINVLMRGIMVDPKNSISVEAAKLTYEGTNSGDTLTVNVLDGGSAMIVTGEGADTLAVNTKEGANSVEIRSGDGADTVTVERSGGEVALDTGDGNDSVTLKVYDSGAEESQAVTVETGKGNDTVNLQNADSGPVAIDTGAGNDSVNLDLRAGTGSLTVETGAGEDTVKVSNPEGDITDGRQNSLDIANAGGDDRIAVDVSVADVIGSVSITEGENASGSVHLTGTLQPKLDKPIEGEAGAFTLTGEHGNKLAVTAGGETRFTDELKNKRVVTLTPDGTAFTYIAEDNFTDYVLAAPVSGLTDMSVTAVEPLTLSNLIVDTDKTLDNGNHLTVNNVDADGLNLVIRGETIDIAGKVNADSVRAEAAAGTGVHQSTLRLDSAEGAADSLAGMAADMFSVYDKAEINVAESAEIHAKNDIILQAGVSHSGGILTLAPDLNAVNVKAADSRITIGGTVSAGEKNGTGSVTAEAKNVTVMGYDANGMKTSGMPIAVSVAVDRAAVTVAGAAKIRASGNITLNAENSIKSATTAESGMAGAPFAAAVNVIVSHVQTAAGGTLEAGSNVTVQAKGRIDESLTASRGTGQESNSGAYVGVNVVEQEVNALVTEGAEITAKGNVTVRSDATANVSTDVTAAQPKKKPEVNMTLDSAIRLAKAVWEPVKGKLSQLRSGSKDDGSLEKFSKKLDKKLKTVADGNYTVTVAEPSANDERGTVTVNTETGANGYLYAKVKATAVPGAKVEKVRIRYLVPGEDHYTYAEPERTDDEGNQVFLINRANAEAIVTFSGAPDGTGSEPDAAGNGNMDLFGNDGEQDSGSVSEIFNTGAGGAAVSADEEEDIYGLQDLFDETKASKLTIEKAENGAVVTYLEEAEGQGLTSVAPGQKVLFVPNPAAGYKLSENSLTMSYTAMEEGQEVRKLDVIAPDSQGRYVFTVPDTLEAAYGLNLYARFEPGKEEKRGDSSNTQATGAVAVNITGNNNLAEIEEGATVNAGGSVNVTANETTNVTASADGTAVSSAGAEPEKGRKEKKPTLKTVTEYRVGGARYAVRINATQYGRVSTAGNAAAGDLTFSVEEGTLNRALLSYRSSVTDKRVTEEITPDGNGKYRIQLVNYAIADGSTAEITFLFKETEDQTVHPNQYAVRNPIAVSFNAKALGKEQDPDGLDYEKLGEAASCGTDADGRYIFHVYATERGYTVAAGSGKTSNTAALWASYTDVKGKAQKVPLARDGEYWALDAQAAGIPAGTVITVCVVFSEDLHPVKASAKQANGKIAIDKDKAKDGDKVTVTLTADKDYAGTGVMVSWVGAKSLKKESAIYDADKDTGVVTFTMPKAAAEGTVTVGGIFAKKEITLKVSNAGEVKLSETGKAFAGEKVTVSPSDENVKKGKKVTQVALSWKDEDGADRSSVSKTGKFTVPEGTKELSIEVTLADKPIEITALETEQGKVAAASARTEVGEKVKIKVQAAEGFRLKQGSLKAEISDRNSSRQIVPDRGSDGYSFTMPADVNPETCKVSFKAVFEEGDGGDGEKTSIGVSVAVSVVTGNNDAAIRGGSITAGKDVKVSAESTGKATAAAVAGYSAGQIGIGGAVSVQVASQDTRARIFADGEGFVSTGGTLTVSAGSNQTFAVTGDASGKAQASKAGVGAGIAVAVSGTETAAAIQDNTNLSGALKGITITAKQKVKDSVTAKAGAAGGTSVVPVAAVDVSGTKASAMLGKAAEELAVAGNIKITSSSSAGHTLKADASATGGKTSLGGAFAVSVLNDSSEAEMSRTAKAKNITLSSRSDSDTSETATAGVSGGLKGKKDAKDSAGSADKQADKLLGGAVKLADKNGSSAVKSGDAAAALKGRQKAQTAEGSFAGAGAVAVNVAKNTSLAEVTDGTDLNAGGKLSVVSVNRTAAAIKANASTTKSDRGVGIGAAVNIVHIVNTARIGDGMILANELEVLAHMPDPTPVSGITVVKAVQNEGAFVTRLKEQAAGAAEKLLGTLGISGETAGKLAADFAGSFAADMLKDMPELRKLLNSSDGVADAVKKAEKLAEDKLTAFAKTAVQPLTELLEEVKDTYALSGSEVEEIFADLPGEFTAQLLKNAAGSVKTLVGKMKDRVLSSAIDMVTDRIQGKGWNTDKLEKMIRDDAEKILSSIVEKTLESVLQQLYTRIPVLNEDNVNTFRELFSRGIEENVTALAQSLKDTFRTEVFDFEKVLVLYEQQDLQKMVTDKLKSAMKAGTVALTNDLLDTLAGELEISIDKPEDLADKHVISTQAISGAGAKDVGVAGSAAIAVISARTEAVIAAGTKELTVAKTLAVDAQENRRVTTTASAAVDSDGNADTNKGAGKTDQKDTGSGSDGKAANSKLYSVAGPGADAPEGMKVAVDGRETKDGKWQAAAGDTVRVTIPKKEGTALESLAYAAGGKTVKIGTVGSENAQETVYVFTMPEADVTAVTATMGPAGENGGSSGESGSTETKKPAVSATETKNGRGQSVGVGASFAFVYGSSDIAAVIGARAAAAGAVKVGAGADHGEKTTAVAGTDPLQTNGKASAGVKDIGVDAAVAVNALDTAIKAAAEKGTIRTAGYQDKDADGKRTEVSGDLTLHATEKGKTENNASGYATGSNTAVGAAVAVNVASSGIRAVMDADADLAGAVSVKADSHSQDLTNAFATALGADIQRALDKAGAAKESIQNGANKLLDGSIWDSKAKDKKDTKNSGNKTAAKINDKLNSKKDKDSGQESSSNLSLSANALRSQDASAQGAASGNEGAGEAGSVIKQETGKDVTTTKNDGKSKFQVAAAVGVNVTDHAAQALVAGRIKAGKGADVSAENAGNFSTLGTGAAMSLANRANSIAAGVAVSVSNNRAETDIRNDIAAKGDISLTAKLTQNMDDPFRSKLAAQALSGSVSGSKSTVTVAGAVAVAVSHASSTVNVAEGTADAIRKMAGANMAIEATDKSKLAVRAGGVSISKGSSVGMGIASGTLVSGNKVEAAIGDYTEITAKSLKLNAEKMGVTKDDFVNPLSMRDLVTDSSKLTDEQRKSADTKGLLDIKKGKDDKNYSVSINLKSQDLLKLAEAANILASQNYYTEAIAGSVNLGQESKLSLAGSAAVTVFSNTVEAKLGSNSKILLTDGGADINASADTNTRVISGAVSLASATASVGAMVAVLTDNDRVAAKTGENTRIDAAGDVEQNAKADADIQLFTAEAAVAAGNQSQAAAGGAVNVMVLKNTAESVLGKGVKIKAGGDASITSDTSMDLMGLSVSVNGGSGKVAAGGTVNVIVDKAKSLATVNDLVSIEAGKNARVTSDVRDQLISGAASASVSSGAGVAGAVSVLVSRSQAETALGTGTALNAEKGTLKVTADSDAWMLNAGLEAAGGGNAGIGGAISVNVFDRDAQVKLANSALSAGENILAQASGKDTSILPALALSGGGNAGISGTVVVMAESNRVKTLAGDGMTANAKHNAVFESYLSDFTAAAAGALAGGGTAGIGAAAVTVIKNNKVITDLGESAVSASNTLLKYEGVPTRSGETARGIWIGANAKETQIAGGAGGAAAGTAAVTGMAATLVNNNIVTADASKASLSAGGKEMTEVSYPYSTVYSRRYNEGRKAYEYIAADPKTLTEADFENETYYYAAQEIIGVPGDGYRKLTYAEMRRVRSGLTVGDAAVRASDDTRQVILAGGLNGAGTAGVGLSAVVLVSNKDVKALARDISGTDVTVSAGNKDQVTQIAVSAGGAGAASVELGAAVQVLKGKVNAEVLGELTASGSAGITADNDARLLNIAAAAGFSGTAAVAPVAAVTYFKGETGARLAGGAKANAKSIRVSASGNKDIDAYTAGAAGSGTAGVSGAANIIIAKDKVRAAMEQGTESNADGDVNVDARSDYKLRGMSAAIGAAGTAGVAVNAVVSVQKGSTAAEIGGTVTAGSGAVNVSAGGARDVISAEAALGAGMAGVGVGVMVLVSGTKMSQDAADMLAYGNAKDRNHGKAAFDADKALASMRKAGIDTADISDLGKETEGNGHRESRIQAGHTEEVTEKDRNGKTTGSTTVTTFDASDTYTSGDLKNTDISSDAEKGRGEKQEFDNDTQDIRNAKNINTYMYTEDPQDAVTARILESAEVAADTVRVTATQSVAADLIGATLGAGAAGIGISAAVAILRSNVIASSQGTLHASGKILVEAASVSGELDGDSEESAAERNAGILELLTNKTYRNDAQKQKADEQKKKDIETLKDLVTTRSIRAFGLAAGAGSAGIGVSVGVVLTDNITEAVLGGTVESTGEVGVEAKHDYGAVMAATGTLAGGAFAAGASVAVAQATGAVKAVIDRNAMIRTKSDLTASTASAVGADSIAVTAGAGALAINAGVAVALNRLKQTTAILSGSSVEAGGEVKVTASSGTDSRSYLAGISIGGTAISLNAAVSDVSADINTYIGESKPSRTGDPSDMPKATVRAGRITVYNDTNSSAVPTALSAALGGIAVGGNVLLAFNNPRAEARVDNARVTAGDLNVSADLAGEAVSRLASAQVGALAVGISVNFADVRAENRAAVYNSILDIRNSTVIATGQGNHHRTLADAQTVTGNVGAVAIGVNAAIARNKTLNYATLLGDTKMSVGELTVHGKGEAEADAAMEGLSIAGLNAAMTAVVAVNDADARATLVSNNLKAKGLNFNVTQDAVTNANAKIGSASLLGLGLTFAMAYGRSAATVDAALDAKDQTPTYDYVSSLIKATSSTKSNISNQDFSLLSVTGTYGAAYSQDIFSNRVQLTGGQQKVNGGVDVRTEYNLETRSTVTPSSSGVSAGLANLSVNAAVAKNTAYVGTDFEMSMGTSWHKSRVGRDVNVTTQGTAAAEAKVIPAAISVNLAKFGANLARADMSLEQAATFRVGGYVNVDGKVNVQSLVGTDGVTAKASVGPNGPGSEDISVSLAKGDVTRAVAKENMVSNASILGAAYTSREAIGLVDNGSYVTKQVRQYNYDFATDVIYYYTIDGTERRYRISSFDFDETSLMWQVAHDIAYYAWFQYKYNKPGGERDLMLRSFVEAYNQYTGNSAWDWDGIIDFFMKYCDHWMHDGQEIIVGTLWGHNIFNYMVSAGYLEPDRTEYIYPMVTATETVWQPKLEEQTVFVPVFDTDSNHLSAGSMNVYAGFENGDKGSTGAAASTGNARGVSVSLLSAGSILAESTSTDEISAMLEGIHARIDGDASIKAQANTSSAAEGYKTADISIAKLNSTDAKAMVGSRKDRQTVNVIIGEGAELSADTVSLSADNRGSALSKIDAGQSISGASLESSSQPTDSWYSTLVTIGKNAQVNGRRDVSVTGNDASAATSTVSTDSIGILFNANTMKGYNTLNQENNIDIGNGARVYSEDGNITIEATQKTSANASTSVVSKSLIGGNMATAQNTVDRAVRVNIGSGALIRNNGSYGNVVIRAASGNGDWIRTTAYMDGKSLVDISKTKAYTTVTSNAEIIMKDGVEISSPTGWGRKAGNITLEAWNTSRNNGDPGIVTSASTNAGSLIPVPDSVAKNDLNFNAYISVNEENKSGKTAVETKNDHNVSISATNRGMNAEVKANSVGKGGVGVSNANAWTNANLTNAVWFGNSKLAGNRVDIYAGNGEGGEKSRFKATAYAELKALGGVVAPVTRVSGVQINQIRTTDGASVQFSANAVTHTAPDPGQSITTDVNSSYKRLELVIKIWFIKITITLTKAKIIEELKWYVYDRCDFCGTGIAVNVNPTIQATIDERYKEAYENAKGVIADIQQRARELGVDASAMEAMRLAKGLKVLTYLNTNVPTGTQVLSKGTYGLGDNNGIDELFVTDISVLLEKDVRLAGDALQRYLLLRSNPNQEDVYMLANATRIITSASGKVKYISEVLRTGLPEEAPFSTVDIITALTKQANNNPVIPLGTDGTLQMKEGILTVPQYAVEELRLSEVSAQWLLGHLDSGFMQAYKGEPENLTAYVLTDDTDELPEGFIGSGLTPEWSTEDGWIMYWLGDDPETAETPEEMLVYLLVNTETDQVWAFRTSVDMLDRNEGSVMVSLYIFRDRKADRQGEECYDVIFFDTPAGSESTVQIITDARKGYTLELPRSLRVSLRGITVDGAEGKAWAVNGHLYVLDDGQDGTVNLFGGSYTASITEDTFESNYTLIEGISTENLTVTVKPGQPVWAEKTGEDTAEDLNGVSYIRTEIGWQTEENE